MLDENKLQQYVNINLILFKWTCIFDTYKSRKKMHQYHRNGLIRVMVMVRIYIYFSDLFALIMIKKNLHLKKSNAAWHSSDDYGHWNEGLSHETLKE